MPKPPTEGGIKCPNCGATVFRVLETRPVKTQNSTRRKKICTNCKYRITTYEEIDEDPTSRLSRKALTRRIMQLERAMKSIESEAISSLGGTQCQQD